MAQARITRTEATRVRPQLKGQCLERTFVVQRGLCVCVFFFHAPFLMSDPAHAVSSGTLPGRFSTR